MPLIELSSPGFMSSEKKAYLVVGRDKRLLFEGDVLEGSVSPEGQKTALLVRELPWAYSIYVANINGSFKQSHTIYAQVNVFARNLVWTNEKEFRVSLTSHYSTDKIKFERIPISTPGTYSIFLDDYNSVAKIKKVL